MVKKLQKRSTIFGQLIKNLLLPILIPFIIISIVYIWHNQRVLNNYNEEKKYILVEKLKTIIEFEDIALAFLEEEHTEKMEKFSNYLVNEVFISTKGIGVADLDKIRKERNIQFDIYIIDQSGEIINTTFFKDLGFNLFQIDKEHKSFLQQIFKGDVFVSERLSLEAKTGRQKKYTYQPTKDHKYIIELGSYSPKATQLINSMQDGIHKLVDNERLSLLSIDLFISKENKKSFISESMIDQQHTGIFERTFNLKHDQDTIIKSGKTYLLYDYIYFKREQTDLYVESVLRIVSDVTRDREFRNRELLIFILVIGITIIVLFLLFYNRAKMITNPITNLVNQIKHVEMGDFTGKVKVEGNNEITHLSTKFNSMIKKLRVLYGDLENKVKQRTILLEKQKKELELQAQELEKLSVVASETDSVVIIMDKFGKFEWVNKAFVKTYGYSIDSLKSEVGESIFDLSSNVNVKDIYHQCIRSRSSVVYRSAFKKPNGKAIWTHTTLTPINDPDGRLIKLIAIETDVTKLVETESKLKKAKVDAEKANQAKSEFLANMSHEIRTPMNSIIGFTELLGNTHIDVQQRNYLESIKTSGKSLLNIINDILDLSKVEAGKIDIKYEPVNLRTIFDEIRRIFSVKVQEKNLDFFIEISKDLPETVLFDDIRLRQILLNLVGNAVKFTRDGFVAIKAEHYYSSSSYSSFDLKISIKDTGIGIKPESLKKIFDPFVQQDSKYTRHYEGTGLGLAITQRFVEMLKGSIRVESEPGKGSIFELYFKNVSITSSPAEPIKSDSKSKLNIKFRKSIIMIVDDIEKNRIIIKDAFKKQDVAVVGAENGRVAIDMALKNPPDLFLMDIRMPVMDGFEATRIIKENEALKQIPVVALTASAMPAERKLIDQHRFDGFLIKPVLLNDLFVELANFLPHDIIDSGKTEKLNGPTPLKFLGSQEELERFISTLDADVLPQYQSITKAFVMRKISKFATDVKGISKKWNYKPLVSFTKELEDSIDSFDIMKTKSLLGKFDMIIQNLRNQVNEEM